MKVAFVMGSDSDLEIVKPGIEVVKSFGVDVEVRVISAHRTPQIAEEFAKNARQNGVGVIVAAAGMAAHLAGVLAAYTTLPVVALPIAAKRLDGLDALLAMVQMPPGIPVATVGIDGAKNAGLLALQILGVSDKEVAAKMLQFKEDMAKQVIAKDEKVSAQF
ncbi:MAG: N5-carboxyaminoimidazole ribonucleotide mutase [Epulopiscium sp. Nele67-Bin002]|nr:MAG: 5-(carboxyamino)imidazole ribonucleotide mutase [Epulopiscium sp. Nuni2H_MBin001]OON92005.1 MAG: N5-carboxyaminoimidazole ribonucleotide mutase [Epulopiscium sp. Nele67-Bin002]OON92335.1 MAG: 5-(carboxyamino)imidazole ribonucleotide mutase [Epulopiscium sp. Nele67-Bin001]